jgi:hypothetical protein
MAEQSNTTANLAEQWEVAHLLHVPVIRVFQSVSLSLKRHVVEPPFEILVQGFVVPGKLATTQPEGIGIWQLWRFSFLAIPKLQVVSVVADDSPRGCAAATLSMRNATNPPETNTPSFICSTVDRYEKEAHCCHRSILTLAASMVFITRGAVDL